MGFIDLEKAYGSVKGEALWQVLRMYDVWGGGEVNYWVELRVCMLIVWLVSEKKGV